MASEKHISKGQAWFCTTGLPSDVVIEVDGMTFHLHKFPLMAKSRKLHEMISEQEDLQIQTVSERRKEIETEENEIDEDEIENQCNIALPDFPGGCDSFELAAKFCYGVKIDLSAANAPVLRCAGEYLQMTEEYSEENLISKSERYFSQSVLRNIKQSIKSLASCENLLPMAENLGIVQRCIESIVARATDPATVFGWPVNGGEAVGKRKSNSTAITDSWLEELGILGLQTFKRLIFEMKSTNLSSEIIESCLIHYAKKYIPGISRTATSTRNQSENDRRELLETIIQNLPAEKSSQNATRFLFGLLRTAYILNASENCRLALEKKIGSQLEQAMLDDLLIPSYSYLNETLYDVDCVERILEYFLRQFEERSVSRVESEDENSSARLAALVLVGKLIDGYLSEIASDANLKPEKFYGLAITLPENARLFDDGLYRAVDVYLKAHPWISESDREKICGVLDCQKLTLEACTHAAQNERLPLRAVVQVLFFEQLQLRHAITGTLIGGAEVEEEDEEAEEEIATVRENQVLRVDMDTMRTRVHELERECSTMKRVIEKFDRSGPRGHVARDNWRSTLTRKFGCKLRTQVCDSHEERVVDGGRKGRHHHHRE